MTSLFKKNILIGLVSVLCLGAATAQQSKVTAGPPTFDDLQSPEFSGGKQKSFKPRNWLEVEAPITVQLAPEPPSKMAERITIKWYVAIKNPEKSGTYLLLTREVEHVNVPLNEEVFVSIYLSPSSLRRITGSDRAGKRAVEMVGYEVFVNGEKKDHATNKGKAGWWEVPSDRIASSTTVQLLNKSETPFSSMWWDRYVEVLPSGFKP